MSVSMDRQGPVVALAVIAAFVLAGCAGATGPASAPPTVASPVNSLSSAGGAAASTSSVSPAPQLTPSARPTAIPLATELEGQWISAPHPIPVLAENSNAALMTLGP